MNNFFKAVWFLLLLLTVPNLVTPFARAQADPPIFSLQPVGRAVVPGTPVTFSATATGTGPITYQWQLNGGNISDATNASYSIAAVATNDFGIYRVIASNAIDIATSTVAPLTLGQIVAWGANIGQII